MTSTHLPKAKGLLLVCRAAVGLALVIAQPALSKTFVVPHILEKSGSISSSSYTFDTTLIFTYNGSLRGNDSGSAQVEFYLYDEQTSLPMQGLTSTVCAPCLLQLDAKHRKVSIRIDDLITARGGGFDSDVKTGFGVFVVSGSQADAVNLQVVSMNSHSNANDVAVFGFNPQEVVAASDPGTPQPRRAFVIPHILESSGRAMVTSNAYDTTLYASYVGGLPGGASGSSASIDLYLYDQSTGELMIGNGGTAVCNPCSFDFGAGAAGAAPRKRTIVMDDLLSAAGAFAGANFKLGFGILVVGGADPDGVALQGFVVNSHTSPFDLSVFGFEPQPIAASARTAARTFVLPHVLESSGLVTTTPFTFDTTLFATYTSGLGGTPQGAGATVDLYLYDDAGQPLRGVNPGPVCGPCSFDLGAGGAGGAGGRKLSIRIDDLITNRGGGFDSAQKLGFGVLVVGGADPDGVNLQGFVVNSHTGPFDVSVFGFEPQEISASRAMSTNAPAPAPKAFVLPHVLEKSGTILDTQFTFDTTIYATYAGGLPGSVSSNGASLKLYLFDSNTGLPLQGAIGDVCNPCMFDLSMAAPKVSITVDDLIVSRGGGFGSATDKDAFGLVTLDGDAGNVALQGFVVNSHTSAFDLSVFGFEPQPLAAARLVPMPIQVSAGSTGLQVLVPTVLGGRYDIEGKTSLDDPNWVTLKSVDGDGTVQTVPLATSTSGQQFLRVKGN